MLPDPRRQPFVQDVRSLVESKRARWLQPSRLCCGESSRQVVAIHLVHSLGDVGEPSAAVVYHAVDLGKHDQVTNSAMERETSRRQ